MGKAMAVWRERAEYAGQAMENEALKELEEALPNCTRRKQEWDAMASTQKFLWI